MDTEKPSDTIPKDLILTHDDYFRETFQVRRIAQAVLKKVLPKATIPHLDLEYRATEKRWFFQSTNRRCHL